jgi:hypothetical protein
MLISDLLRTCVGASHMCVDVIVCSDGRVRVFGVVRKDGYYGDKSLASSLRIPATHTAPASSATASGR